jgi:GNAT superfamily N-acetyltransferase
MSDIAPLTPVDWADWLPLWQAYLTFYEATIPPETTRVTFTRLIDLAEPMGGFIARNELGHAVGIAHWIMHRSCWTVGDYCYLQDLFVMPTQRGLGIGRRLAEAVSNEAQSRGCSRVHWLTQETNVQARNLYDQIGVRSGFIQYRRMLT